MKSRNTNLHWHYRAALLMGVLAGLLYGDWAGLVRAAEVVLLTNGEVLRGDVVRQGDHLQVRLEANGSMTVDKLDVQHVGTSIHEVYDYLRAEANRSPAVEDWIRLADWCLQHELWDACDELLAELRASHRHQAELRQLSARLAEARALSRANPIAHHAPQTARRSGAVGPDDLVPTKQLSEFCAFVQPLLINSCVQCHGPTCDAAFSLQRPRSGHHAGQRLTQANLLAVLAAIEQGQLLTSCSTAHGGSNAAPASRWRHQQMDRLTQWVAATTAHLNRSEEDPTTTQDGAEHVDPFDPGEFNQAITLAGAPP